ncbi:MAG: SCO1664 family protein [Acidimicrobiales bacterium]
MLAVLSNGEVELKGRIPWSSNATFLAAVRARGPGTATGGPVPPAYRDVPPGGPGRQPSAPAAGQAMLAIYKPAKGERALWDFPRGLWQREVAAYELARWLGWDLVPPTVARGDGPLGRGSLQYFVDASLDEHYFTLVSSPEHHRALRRIATFDLVANNADRKGGHCLLDQDGHIWAIDNGLCFHVQPKLRTVIWDFAGERVDDDLLDSLGPLAGGTVPAALEGLLGADEIGALVARAVSLRRRRRYPGPASEFPYPWPLI